jgi:hypothetical protein
VEKMRWAGLVALMERRGSHRLLVGKIEGKRALGTPRNRWMNLGVTGWENVDVG